MTMPPSKTANINTLLAAVSLGAMLLGGAFFVAPLRTLPGEMTDVKHDLSDVAQTQAVQTEALKTLAEVAKDARDTRRDVDKHSTELDGVKRRLDRLESR